MKIVRALVPALCLSAALLAGCSQQGTPAGSAPAQGSVSAHGSAPVASEEKTPEPVMSNWTETSFYERPVTDIAADLELLGFEMEADENFVEEESGYSYYIAGFTGTPSDIPVPDVADTVFVQLTVEYAQFAEGAEEQNLSSLVEGTTLTSCYLDFYHTDVDPSAYEGIAQQVIDALGLEPMTSSSTEPSLFDETRMLGNYAGPATFLGSDTEYLIMIMKQSNGSLPDPEKPLSVSVNLFSTFSE